MNDQDVFCLKAEYFSGDLCHHGVRTLAHVDRAAVHATATVAIQRHHCYRGRGRDRRLQSDSDASTSTPRPPATIEGRLPVHELLEGLQHFRQPPHDPEGVNGKRAAWAGASRRTFIDQTGADEEDALGDLLGDLMHWSDRHDYDFDAALDRARFHYEAETSAALGFGYRCGFLGLLHLEIIQERLEREYNLDILATAPSVEYQVMKMGGEVVQVDNPSAMPSFGEIEQIEEPVQRCASDERDQNAEAAVCKCASGPPAKPCPPRNACRGQAKSDDDGDRPGSTSTRMDGIATH